MEAEGVVERVRDDLGPYLAKRWSELAEHPLVGKEILAAGMYLFGDTPRGWRIMPALFGSFFAAYVDIFARDKVVEEPGQA